MSITRCLVVVALMASVAGASDTIRVKGGPPMIGAIVKMSPDEVVLEQGPLKKNIPVNQILVIEYDEDPTGMSVVRSAYNEARYADVLAALKKINAAEIKRDEVIQDIEFYRAAASSRLALGGAGSTKDAGRMLVQFEGKHSGSYHYLEACELLGDLLVAANNITAAQKYYDKLADSQFPELKLKANILQARALESQKDYDKAIAKYDEVISAEASTKEAQAQQYAAICGKATALAATGKSDEAIKMVEEVLSKADAADLELHARAYNALGSSYRAAGKKKEALLWYLHTDLLFSGFPEQHAEALAALADLWNDADKADRALQARSTLKDRYPGSRWAQNK